MFTISQIHQQMHTVGLETLHKFWNSYMLRGRGAILRESQKQRSTSTNTSYWEV